EQPLAASPIDAGEVSHVRAGLDQHRGEAEPLHQPPRFLAPLLGLALGYRRGRVQSGRVRDRRELDRIETEKRGRAGEGRAVLDELAAFHRLFLPLSRRAVDIDAIWLGAILKQGAL